MTSRIIYPAPSIIDPTRTRRVHPLKVPVRPRQSGNDGDSEPAHGQESGGDEEENGADRNPNRTRYEDQRRKKDQTQNSRGDRQSSEKEKNRAGDDEGQDSDELGGIGCMLMESTEERGSCLIGSRLGSVGLS